MEITKNRSLEVSEKFFNNLEKKLERVSDNLAGYYKTFNNCREQGLMLTIYEQKSDDELLIWACECRNSDSIMVIIADRSCSDINDMFDDKAWRSAKYFKYDDYDGAIDYTMNIIKKQFDKYFLKSYSNSFVMNKCLSDLEKIIDDANILDYDDYKILADFEDINSNYFCNLVIHDGKVGLDYYKYKDQNKDEFEKISFEEWTPDLTTDKTLMLGMQNKLNDFMEKEIDYDLTINI